MINALKQAVQFGLDKQVPSRRRASRSSRRSMGLPPEARIGTWVFEWYWNQPNVPHVADFVARSRRRPATCPPRAPGSASRRRGRCALAANQAKSLDAVKMAKALQNIKLPPEVGLMPDQPFFRAARTS